MVEAYAQWTPIRSEADLPQWPKNYLWQWKGVDGKPKIIVRKFDPIIDRSYFAGSFVAWMPLPSPYQEQGDIENLRQ